MGKRIVWENHNFEIDTKSGIVKEDSDDREYDDDKIPTFTVTPTAFGAWRTDDAMHPMKQFKLWMAHTNFSITGKVAKQIESINGVELLRILTKYRFIIGIGKAFETDNIKSQIEDTLCDKIETDKISNLNIKYRVEKLTKFLSEYKKWAILVFPNGNIEFSTNSYHAHDEVFQLYQKIQKITGSILIHNE